jgi:hypothetical protein
MRYDRVTKTINANERDWTLLEKIARLKSKTEIPELGLWRQRDDEFLWQGLVEQVANRGGTRWYYKLEATGRLGLFRKSLSLEELLKRPPSDLPRYVRKEMEEFNVDRFRKDNTLSILANFTTFVDSEGRIKLRKLLDHLDPTLEPLSPEVQAREREARGYLMGNLVFYQQGKEYHAKRKPPSDYLISAGFARSLLAFDTRLKKAFKELFGLRISEENYEPIEDWFLTEAFPTLAVKPSDFDRITFQNEKEILR